MSGKDGNKKGGWWFDFGYCDDSKFRKKGHYSCSLADVVKGNAEFYSAKVIDLSKRNLPFKKREESELEDKPPAPPPSRFNVHFVGNPLLPSSGGGTDCANVKTLLKTFYTNHLEQEIATDVHYGDGDAVVLAGQFIDNVLSHSSTYHILLTVCEQKDLSDGSSSSTMVPIAALSFCSHKNAPDRLVVSLVSVSPNKYTKSYGRNADDEPWRRRGLSRFLFQVCRKLHSTLLHHEGDVLVLMTPLTVTSNNGILRKMGFRRIGQNLKNVYGYPYVADTTTLHWKMRLYTDQESVPYLMTEDVFCLFCKF